MTPIAADGNSRTLRLVAIGLVAGLFSALFGVGGGLVMVPLLIMWIAMDSRVASATSLAAIIVTATVSAATHGALGNVPWEYALLIGLPAVAGVLIGLAVKRHLSSRILTLAFAGLLLVVAVWLVVEPSAEGGGVDLTVPRALAVMALGILAGGLAGLFGVGGGILFVPVLTLIVGLSQIDGEGASLLAIIPVAVVGSWRQHREGTVRWADAAVLGVASVSTAIAGALIADATPERTLRALFAIIVVATAAQLAWRGSRRETGDQLTS